MKKNKDIGASIVTLSIVLNAALLLLKGTVGLLTKSAALQADAVNSAGDVLSNTAILFGVKYSLKPRDKGHHYGHGKMEALVSLFVGVVIFTSTVFLWSSIIATFASGELYKASIWALAAAIVSIGVKAFLYIKTSKVGKTINSIAVQTNAKDHRNDIIATSGTVLAIFLVLLGERLGTSIFNYAEGIAAALTSVFILKTGIEIVLSSARVLIDAAPDAKTMESIEKTILSCNGVEDIEWLKCRTTGRGLLVDAAVEVAPDMSVKQGHEIVHKIIKKIQRKYKTVLEVQVQINPDEDLM
ncbi:MAG: cation diffusion facilitator family transporter [Eubacteriales bacterium]